MCCIGMLHNGQVALDCSWSLSEKNVTISEENHPFQKEYLYVTSTAYNGYLHEVILRAEWFKYGWD